MSCSDWLELLPLIIFPYLYLILMTMMTVRMRMMRVAIIPARIPRKGVNCNGTGDSEIQHYTVWGHNHILNLPTWSWATLVVNTSSVTGSLFPFPFSAEMISLTSRPGLRPVTVKWGLMEDTLARTRLLRPSTTSRTKTWSRPPSNPGWHSTWINSVVCRAPDVEILIFQIRDILN